jgi:Na+-driven multidrug efflux pump
MAAIFASVMLFGGRAIYALMGGQGEALSAAVEYSNVIFGGAVVYWALSALTSVVRGTGQPTVLAIVYLAAEALHTSSWFRRSCSESDRSRRSASLAPVSPR